MELNFIKCGDYYIPDIKLKNPNIRLGKWGRMRKEYLRLANPCCTLSFNCIFPFHPHFYR